MNVNGGSYRCQFLNENTTTNPMVFHGAFLTTYNNPLYQTRPVVNIGDLTNSGYVELYNCYVYGIYSDRATVAGAGFPGLKVFNCVLTSNGVPPGVIQLENNAEMYIGGCTFFTGGTAVGTSTAGAMTTALSNFLLGGGSAVGGAITATPPGPPAYF